MNANFLERQNSTVCEARERQSRMTTDTHRRPQELARIFAVAAGPSVVVIVRQPPAPAPPAAGPGAAAVVVGAQIPPRRRVGVVADVGDGAFHAAQLTRCFTSGRHLDSRLLIVLLNGLSLLLLLRAGLLLAGIVGSISYALLTSSKQAGGKQGLYKLPPR